MPWKRRLRNTYSLYWGFKKITFSLFTYVLTKILQNGATFTQKLTLGFKNYMRNLENIRQALESPKNWNLMGYINLSKKYIPSAKTLYTEGLTFKVLLWKLTNYLCHYNIFLDTTPLSFFSWNTTYFLRKYYIKVQVFRLSAAQIEVHKIPHIIFQIKCKFFFNVWISFLYFLS